ncbi:MAG: hypothetical protein ACYC5M_09565 [Anaerolineae bacterium]
MHSSFKQGVLVGVIAPLAFLAGVVYWIYRFTNKVPFPVQRPAVGELTVRLIDVEEVPLYWQGWKRELEPAWLKLKALIEDVKVQYLRMGELE